MGDEGETRIMEMRDRDEYDRLIARKKDERLRGVFAQLSPRERQLLTAALAGNHPNGLADEREPVIRALAWADLRPLAKSEDPEER